MLLLLLYVIIVIIIFIIIPAAGTCISKPDLHAYNAQGLKQNFKGNSFWQECYMCLVSQPLSAVGMSEGNAQGWKVVQTIKQLAQQSVLLSGCW